MACPVNEKFVDEHKSLLFYLEEDYAFTNLNDESELKHFFILSGFTFHVTTNVEGKHNCYPKTDVSTTQTDATCDLYTCEGKLMKASHSLRRRKC